MSKVNADIDRFCTALRAGGVDNLRLGLTFDGSGKWRVAQMVGESCLVLSPRAARVFCDGVRESLAKAANDEDRAWGQGIIDQIETLVTEAREKNRAGVVPHEWTLATQTAGNA